MSSRCTIRHVAALSLHFMNVCFGEYILSKTANKWNTECFFFFFTFDNLLVEFRPKNKITTRPKQDKQDSDSGGSQHLEAPTRGGHCPT